MVVLKCPGWPVKGVLIRTLPVGGKVHRADVASSNQTVAGSGNVAVRATRVRHSLIERCSLHHRPGQISVGYLAAESIPTRQILSRDTRGIVKSTISRYLSESGCSELSFTGAHSSLFHHTLRYSMSDF